MKPCGTVAAYQRHLNRGEDPCDACRKASREAGREYQRKAKRGRPKPAVRTPGLLRGSPTRVVLQRPPAWGDAPWAALEMRDDRPPLFPPGPPPG